jgi:precorrin-2 dehydrogenase/sirohydrochlorin ferrochelatase
MFPIVVNLTGRLAVVVGGGSVGRRKIAALLAAGARVRVVCPEPPPADEFCSVVEWLPEAYCPGHLDGAILAFAAATPEVNARVLADARARGILVNVATDPESGDFLMPATIRRGDFVLAVSTSGAAPAFAAEIRRRLEEQFDETFGRWVALLAEIRPIVLANVHDSQKRRELFERWAKWEWLERLRREGEETVRAALLAEAGIHSSQPIQ